MSNKTTDENRNNDKSTQPADEKKRVLRKGRPFLSECLEDHPVLFAIGTIFVLAIIASSVWFALRCLQSFLRSKEINLFSMDAGLFDWFSLFISYAGAAATAILGILTIRLTMKQDRNNDYAAISELRLDNFLICDLWHKYTPSRFDRDRGRRFVLAFDITGLKAYYSIQSIELYWKSAGKVSTQYTILANQEVLHQSPCETKVTAYFDEFPDCPPVESIYYFLRLDLYEPEMMAPEEKRRWLQARIKLDHADDKTESDVCCDYLLEYTAIKEGTVCPKLIDRRVRISSSPRRSSKKRTVDKT